MAVRRPPRDLLIPVVVMLWIGIGAAIDHDAGIWRQRAVGFATWSILLLLLRGEPRRVRAQVSVVMACATVVEFTASPLLGMYIYRLHNVPLYVPAGHGMIYLAALALGRSAFATRHARRLTFGALGLCGAWALWGVTLAARSDVLGLLLFLCLVRFVLVGRQPLVYAGAFVVCTYLELVGTGAGAWTWAPHGPMGWLSQGNPPSGIPGAYCFLDAAGLRFAPQIVGALERLPALRVRGPAPVAPLEEPSRVGA
jgi:hypothetical protein